MSVELILIIGASLLLLLISIRHFIKCNDELPVFIATLNLCFLWRLISIQAGIGKWIIFQYGIPFDFTVNRGVETFSFILIGMYVMIISYCWSRKSNQRVALPDNLYFQSYLCSKKNFIIMGLFAGLLFAAVSSSYMSTEREAIDSYTYLFPFFRSSLIILGMLLILSDKISTSEKFFIAVLVTANILTTFIATARFILIAWGIIFILLVVERFGKKNKGVLYLLLGSIFLLVFSILGISRHKYLDSSYSNLFQTTIASILEFQDFNMIDGLVMLTQVYPKYLDYSFGMGHLEVLFRPIPRYLWPGKPVGAWQQKFAISQAHELYGSGATPHFFGVGISPTLFGDFYAEAGLIGIIIFSIIYGRYFAKIINFSDKFSSDCRILIKGVMLASLFPLLRGGDLPGSVAFVLLAFWPIIILVFFYNKKVDKVIKQQMS